MKINIDCWPDGLSISEWPIGNCFWCGVKIYYAPRHKQLPSFAVTRDHFISKPLKTLLLRLKFTISVAFKDINGRKSCRSCNECNSKRARISSALGQLLIIRRRIGQGEHPDLQAWFAIRANIIHDIGIFRERIVSKLPPQLAELCLKELDELS